MKRFGRVVAVSDLSMDLPSTSMSAPNTPAIWVEIDGLDACQRCARGQGCGSAMLDPRSSTVRVLCRSEFPVSQSQRVTVSIDEPDSRWLWIVAGAYGLPLAGLLAGALLGTALSPEELVQSAVATERSELDSMLVHIPSVIMQEATVATAALLGLIGGVFAWRYVSRSLSAWIETGLCLDSARIVAVSAPSLETVG